MRQPNEKGAKLGPVSIFTRCKVFLCGPVQSVPTWSRPVPFITALPMGLSRSSSVCIVAGQVRIDGVPSAAVLPADRLGRALPSLQLCRRLEPGELLLLSVTNPASFDSRYFGPVSASAVIGVAHPVWPEIRP